MCAHVLESLGVWDAGDAAPHPKFPQTACLEELYLDNCEVYDEGAEKFGEALKVNKTLKVLSLKANEISEKVSIQAKNCADDLAKAEPAVEEAMKALDTLNKKDLSECKTMLKPPAGVDDVFAATQVLLAGVHPNVVVNKRGQVKDKSWDAAKKQLMGNIGEYLEALKGFNTKPKLIFDHSIKDILACF